MFGRKNVQNAKQEPEYVYKTETIVGMLRLPNARADKRIVEMQLAGWEHLDTKVTSQGSTLVLQFRRLK